MDQYQWTEIEKELAKIIPGYVPLELRSKEEQEEAYDRVFDWENEEE